MGAEHRLSETIVNAQKQWLFLIRNNSINHGWTRMDTDEDKAKQCLQGIENASLISELICFAEVFFYPCSSVSIRG